MTTTTDEANDFLLGGGAKSFPFDNIGDTVRGTIVDMNKRQQTSLEGELLTWADGSPRMLLVITLQTAETNDDDDGLRTVYVKGGNFTPAHGTGSSMKNAVADAIKKAGASGIETGGTLAVRYSGSTNAERGKSPAKCFTASYAPPVQHVAVDDLL